MAAADRAGAPLFDAIVMVDWSAAAAPKTGKDSIWWALHRPGAPALERLENPATRAEAIAALTALAAAEGAAGRRVLIGFDFPFGYPAGAAARMLAADPGPAPLSAPLSAPLWARLWAMIAARISDGPANANNRFDLAEALNRDAFDGRGPFWARPPRPERAHLPAKKPSGYGARYPSERRICERRARSAQPVWKLFTAGSVGGQALMGIAALERMRRDPRLAGLVQVWPFETGLCGAGAFGPQPVVIAEIYPSLLPPDPGYAVKDAGQVAAMARRLADLAAAGRLGPLFAGPADLTAEERRIIEAEEAWILGLGQLGAEG